MTLPQAGAPERSMAKLAEQDRWNGFTRENFVIAKDYQTAGTAVAVSAERYGRVPKVCVKTLRDRAISPQIQQQMIERTPVRRVVELDSGHSPFLSQPQALAQALLEAARD